MSGSFVAAIALLQLSDTQLAAPVMATVRTVKSVRLSPVKECVETLVLGSIEREEFVQADALLKLHGVAGHGNFLLLALIYSE